MNVNSKTDFLPYLKAISGNRTLRQFSILCVLSSVLALGSCKASQKTTVASKTDTGNHKKQAQAQTKFDKETQEKLDRLFLDAEKDKVTEDWDDAIKSYQEVLGIDPYNADAHFQLAQIYINKNKLSDAENEVLAAIKIEIDNKW